MVVNYKEVYILVILFNFKKMIERKCMKYNFFCGIIKILIDFVVLKY